MRTFLTYLFLTIISVSYCFGQIIEEKERELFERYKVKERTKYDYKYTGGVIAKTGIKTSISKYNTKGFLLESYTYSKKGDIITTEIYGYDENGNRTQYERKSMTGAYKKSSEYNEEDKLILELGYDGSAAFKTVYKYNVSNKVTEISYYVENMLDEKRVYSYYGKSAKVQVLHKGKDLKSKIELLFNNSGDILEEKIISVEGAELEKRTREYNPSGLLIKESKYRGGNLTYTMHYNYDAKGNLVKITEDSKSKGKFDKKLYKYDTSGRVVEYKWTRKPGEEYNVKSYTYGSNGLCAEELTYYPKTNYKLLSKYQYKFY